MSEAEPKFLLVKVFLLEEEDSGTWEASYTDSARYWTTPAVEIVETNLTAAEQTSLVQDIIFGEPLAYFSDLLNKAVREKFE